MRISSINIHSNECNYKCKNIRRKNEKTLSTIQNLQSSCCLKLGFQNGSRGIAGDMQLEFQVISFHIWPDTICQRIWSNIDVDQSSCGISMILRHHYSDVAMYSVVSQIAGVSIVCPIFYLGAGQRKHQSSVSLAFVKGIHRWPVNSPHKWPVTRKMLPFDDFIMTGTSQDVCLRNHLWFETQSKRQLREYFFQITKI